MNISIHALREEGDLAVQVVPCEVSRFLSTPSARRATDHAAQLTVLHKISIHALREEGDQRRKETPANGWSISIHALREEGDEYGHLIIKYY